MAEKQDLRKMLLGRRLREALVQLEMANSLLDAETAENEGHQPLLQAAELELMAQVVAKSNELVAGYEDLLPQGV